MVRGVSKLHWIDQLIFRTHNCCALFFGAFWTGGGVSSRWAPGSSGSAVLDAFGNAIGHVATISTMDNGGSRKDNEKGNILITLHSATPARAMMALARLSEDQD